jgi:hypothetical protein
MVNTGNTKVHRENNVLWLENRERVWIGLLTIRSIAQRVRGALSCATLHRASRTNISYELRPLHILPPNDTPFCDFFRHDLPHTT